MGLSNWSTPTTTSTKLWDKWLSLGPNCAIFLFTLMTTSWLKKLNSDFFEVNMFPILQHFYVMHYRPFVAKQMWTWYCYLTSKTLKKAIKNWCSQQNLLFSLCFVFCVLINEATAFFLEAHKYWGHLKKFELLHMIPWSLADIWNKLAEKLIKPIFQYMEQKKKL